jgi:peroxiredoxin
MAETSKGAFLMFRNVFVTSVLAAALLLGCTKSESPDSKAADFTLQDMHGKNIKLSDFRGKVVLIDFWATWCPPCIASVPGLEKIHKSYKNKGLVVLAISMDGGEWDSVKSFMKYYGITYPVLKGDDDVAVQYQVRAIPLLLILDREGKIAKRHFGLSDEDDLEKEIKAVL